MQSSLNHLLLTPAMQFRVTPCGGWGYAPAMQAGERAPLGLRGLGGLESRARCAGFSVTEIGNRKERLRDYASFPDKSLRQGLGIGITRPLCGIQRDGNRKSQGALARSRSGRVCRRQRTAPLCEFPGSAALTFPRREPCKACVKVWFKPMLFTGKQRENSR